MAQMARLVSLLVMGAVVVLLAITFYHVMAPFLMPLFLAGVLAVLCQPLYLRILGWTKNRTAVAAGLTTFIVLTIVFVPLTLGTIRAAKQLYQGAQTRLAKSPLKGSDWSELPRLVIETSQAKSLIAQYEEWTGETVNPEELEAEVQSRLREGSLTLAGKTLGFAGSTLSLLGSAVSFLVGSLTFVIALYFFLADGPALIEATERLIPVHRDYVRNLLMQFDRTVRAVVLATFAAALGQGIATGIGMQVAGFRHFYIVTILATLTALVPVLGTWLIWGPFAVWLWFNGNYTAAVMLTLYGSVFVGLLDNVIRSYILHSNAKLHPLLAFVSVLGGIQVMGLWGIFIGPIVASCLHALLKIFNTELVAFSEEKPVPVDHGPAAAAQTISKPHEPNAIPAVVATTDNAPAETPSTPTPAPRATSTKSAGT